MSVNVRLRHSKGVNTIKVELEAPVSELQQAIFSYTEIPPSQQDLKIGYPPKSLEVVSELPVSSLGIKNGEQLIVASKAVSSSTASSSTQQQAPASRQAPPVQKSASVSASAFEPKVPPRQELQSDVSVDIPEGTLVHRVVPDDNSCLFSSIGIVLLQDMNVAPQLRQIVVDAIRADPSTYSDPVLGRPREEYMKTIAKPSAWGGAIELSIFSTHYQTEIASFDVETGRCDRFGEGLYDNRAILIYSGIHYDAVSLAPARDAPLDFHQTVFPASNERLLKAAGEIASKLRAKKAYTNTSTFDLKCQRCGKGLKGEKEARQHAQDTGHAEFGEY